MSAFSERMTKARAERIVPMFGVSAVYTNPDGTVGGTFPIRIVNKNVIATNRNGVDVQTETGVAHINRCDFSTLLVNGCFNCDGEVWTIDQKPVETNGNISCQVSRLLSGTVARQTRSPHA